MSYVKLISYVISCTFSTFIVFDFMNQMFKFGYSKFIYRLTQILFTSIWMIINLFEIPILNFTYFAVASFLVGFFLYHAKQIKDIIQIEILIISYALCDTTAFITISVITNMPVSYCKESPFFLFLNVVIVQILLLIVNRLLLLLFRKNNYSKIKRYEFIYLFIFPLINIAIIYLLIITVSAKGNTSSTDFVMIFLSIVSPLLNITEIALLKYVSKLTQLEFEITIMQQQIDMQYSYYQQLECNYEKSQRIMHDIKKHINVIQGLYQKGNFSEGEMYAKEINKIIDANGLKFKSHNKILNIILSEKIDICKKENIKFTYLIDNLDLTFLTDIDLTTIFANLFDNAIDACRQINSSLSCIELKIYQFNSMVVIDLANTIAKQPIREGTLFVSSKKGHKAIGLSNVKNTVLKYSGDMSISVEQSKFAVNIVFPLNEM